MAVDTSDRAVVRDLFTEYARTRDIRLRDELVAAHLSLAEHLARRFNHRGEPLDDLIQVASLGLLKSIDRFDPDRGLEFSTFAIPTIVGELKRHFRDKGWAVRVPRRVQELHLRLASVVGELSQTLGRSPTIPEIAEAADASDDDVLDAIEAGRAYRSASLDTGAPDDDDEDSTGLATRLGDNDPGMINVERRATLSPLLSSLPPREQAIIHLRFFEGMTQSEIARELGISQMHVSRLLARSLEQLRERAATQPVPD
jgi:RNA polymerase sigma-B factor